LRTAIDMMPPETREAMLRGIEMNPIIVGAYSDRDGGICPMLAAHRNGGRTSFASFAHAWDRYARAGDTPRRATEREVSTLRSMLQASLAVDSVRGGGSFEEAITDHRRTQVRRALREEHDVSAEPAPDLVHFDARRYGVSPGRMNCSSGTMHAGDVRSR
jgi:hypothetical protein